MPIFMSSVQTIILYERKPVCDIQRPNLLRQSALMVISFHRLLDNWRQLLPAVETCLSLMICSKSKLIF